MSNEKTMYLNVETDVMGSECRCDMGVTPEQWNSMVEEDQNKLKREFMHNICNVWVDVDYREDE